MADQQVTKSKAKVKQKYQVRDRQVIMRPAQDIKEALLGGNLVTFTSLVI